MQGMGMMQRGKCRHDKGYGGMKHQCKHSGAGGKGKRHHDKHAEVVQRLDMIEARMAKIEAMLESLMRR